MKNTIFIYFLVGKGLSNDDVGEARGTVFQKIRPGAGFETGDFVKEKLGGGATVERLVAKWNNITLLRDPFSELHHVLRGHTLLGTII